MNVLIVGTGYVGLTTGVCLAYIGHKVTCIDVNAEIVEKLNRGEATIHEPALQTLLQIASQNLSFSTSMAEAVSETEIIIIAVGTPPKDNGDADVSAVESVAQELGKYLSPTQSAVIVNKSTVPIGSARRVEAIITACLSSRKIDCDFTVASNPEFLREGSAIQDMLYPDRIVIGVESIEAADKLRKLYQPILEQAFLSPPEVYRPEDYDHPKLLITSPTSAELIKYASNCFLATKISFINEFAGLAEKVGADICEVAQGIGLDRRIGPKFLEAGLGWGGSCFGKDTRAIVQTASQYGHQMSVVEAAVQANYRQRLSAVEKLQHSLKVVRGCTIGILGLSFKPWTDDLRDAPAIDIIRTLLERGSIVRVYDPISMEKFKTLYPDLDVVYCSDPVELCRNCDAVVIVTDWPQFHELDWCAIGGSMRRKILIDGRNLMTHRSLESQGFTYLGVGVAR